MSKASMWVPRDPLEFKRAGVELIAFVRIDGEHSILPTEVEELQAAFDGGFDVFPRRDRVILGFEPDIDPTALRVWFNKRGIAVEEFPATPGNIDAFALRELGHSVRIAA